MNDLKNIEICVFDAYGTLFDVHSASRKYQKELGSIYNDFSNLWRAKQLEYSFLYEIMDNYIDFFDITSNALDYACNTFNILDSKLKINLLNSYMELTPYPEVASILKKFKEKGIKTMILSNGSYHMLNAALTSSNLVSLLDDVISVEDVKTFKPNKKVYNMVIEKYNVAPSSVAFFSSNGWDILGATKFGFNTIWINRFEKATEVSEFQPTFIKSDLSEAFSVFP